MSILQSIKPQYCELIASGKKTIEVRKTRPKLDVPFKVYIYCTKDRLLTKSHNNGNIYLSENKYKSALEKAGNVTLSGKVIGEYVCDKIIEYSPYQMMDGYIIPFLQQALCCLSQDELWQYGKGKTLYGWHISDLKIYDKPKELSEFFGACKQPKGTDCSVCRDNREQSCWQLTHPPQSWCYVEGLQE